MSILVLGSKGQLGQCFKDHLNDSFQDIFFLSKDDINIIDFKEVSRIISYIKPNIILNAAAYTDVDGAEDNQEIANFVNHLALKNLAETCKKTNALLIHFSTDYVFNGKTKESISENFETNPINIYGQSKLDGEVAVIESGCRYMILRTSWVYSEYGKNFLNTMFNISKKDKIHVINDQYGCPTYARDIAKTIIKIIPLLQRDSYKSGVYHYCGDAILSWFEFAQAIFKEIAKYDIQSPELIPIDTSLYKSRAKRPSFSILDCTKIIKEFNCIKSNTHDGIMLSLKSRYDKK